jgi:3-mercaptopyruvate sulfurtransferase SseA
VHGALIAERNVLEWRFDPASDACLDIAAYDLRVIVVCKEDYTSSLAAAALQDLRISGATDVLGGYRAWHAAGLPTRSPVTPTRDEGHADGTQATTPDSSDQCPSRR